jgi:Protein of unknown function (DUF742)
VGRPERDPARAAPVHPDGVRPYVITNGRTRPELSLSWETMIWTTGRGAASIASGGVVDERRRAVELCTSPRSVAEVAGLLGLPIGVSRILLSDLTQQGAVTAHRPADVVDREMVTRLLKRLRTL